MKRAIVVIAHNLRSTHNVGSLLRTTEGLGISHVYLTGYTPYPICNKDYRLPHEALKINRAIQKTALGAQDTQSWSYHGKLDPVVSQLKTDGYTVVALEQSDYSVHLPDWKPPKQVALLLGREVEGVETEVLKLMDHIIEIPMFGKKESFNVTQAAAMALFYLRFTN